MTILLVSFGGPGDIYPMLAVGQTLRKRSHRVILISNPLFEELARRLDLEFVGFGSAQHLVDSMAGAARPSCGNGISGFPLRQRIIRGLDRWRRRSRGMLGTMRWLYAEIEKIHVPGETILVARGNAFGARIASEKLRIPLATVHLQPSMFHSEYDAPGLPISQGAGLLRRLTRRGLWFASDQYGDWLLAAEMNRFRAEIGLSPVRHPFSKWLHSPYLILGMFPDWFAPPQPDWPHSTRLVGFPLFDERVTREIPKELESFMRSGQPPVIFTAGSFHRNSGQFFEASVKACLKLGIRGLLLSGSRGCIPEKLPATVLHLSFVPLSAALPQSQAIVHHGGIGTAGLAFAAGTPQLVVPFADDQHENAARIERAGAGIQIPLAEFCTDAATRLQELMRSQPIAEVCRSLAVRISTQNAANEAADLIEQLRPIIREKA